MSQIKDVRNISSLHRFNIYVKNRRAGLLKALEITYPVCQKLVGEKYFRAMVDTYLAEYPSYSPSLNDYGSRLAEALLDSLFVLDLPYLIDVVRLEWSIHCILIGNDEQSFDWRELVSIPSDQYNDLIFQRPENSVLMHSRFLSIVFGKSINQTLLAMIMLIWRKEKFISVLDGWGLISE